MELRRLLSTYVVTSSSDDPGTDSLRWAIEQANASQSASVIDFNVDATGPVKIQLDSPLPPIAVPVLVDGTTQPGYQGAPLIEVDGSGLTGGGGNGLVLSASGSTVRGLALGGFSGSAIVLEAQGGDAVASSYLGLDPTGETAIPNGQGLTILGSSSNTIGLGLAGGGNVISGNTGDGILIEDGDAGSAQNLIAGNRIGTNADGSAAAGNGLAGIAIAGAGSGDNSIGGTGEPFGNVISGNAGAGVQITGGAVANAIQDNFIGLAADGKTPLGNQGDGILLDDAPQTSVGGTDLGEGNVISANQGNGINTASDTAGLWVAGNLIGTDVSGQLAVGNNLSGINLASSANLIGGTTAGAANVIEYNGTGRVGAGVQLVGQVGQDTILSNSIFANAGLGINLGSGPTPNHAPGTPGPNGYQNYPSLNSAQSDGSSILVQGTMFASPNSGYYLQFFSSPRADSSGYGQGQTLIGSMNVVTDAQGNATFSTTLPGSMQAGAVLSATATGSSGDTSEFSADLVVQGQINLVVGGTATPNPVLAGGDVTYTLTVANQGLADAHQVMLNDQLPPGVSVVAVSPSQGYVVPVMGGGTVGVELGTITAGGSATVTIVVQTGPGSAGTITDKASVTSEETDTDSGTESTAIPVLVETNADVSVGLAEGPSPALAGGDLTYTMTVDNHGPDIAPNVVASLPIASDLSFVSATSDIGNVGPTPDGPVVADLGDMPPGAQATVTVVLQATAAGAVTETASVSSDTLDPNPSDSTSSVTTTIDPASDLSVGIAADDDVAAVGVTLNYTLNVTNNGPSDASGVVLTDTLPAGANFIDATDDLGNAAGSVDDGVLTWTIGALQSGDSASLVIAVDPTASPGSSLTDSASVAGQQADPDPANNTASLSVPVRGVSDLGITAALASGAAYVGQTMTYTISVTNQGPADEPDAVVSSILPAGLVVQSTSSTQGSTPSVAQGIFTADLGPMASGASADVTLVVTPGTSDVGVVTTGFSVQGQDYDPDPTDNVAVVTAGVAASADLGVTIVPGAGSVVAQVDWTYAVHVTNAGPSQATGVVATIPLPAGVQLVSASSSQGLTPVPQGGSLAAELGTLASGGSATITIVVDPAPASSGGPLALTASVAGNEHDPNPANNQASDDPAVAPSVNVVMNLACTPQVVPSGQVVTFSATVINQGPTPATDVLVTFPSVGGLAFVSGSPSQGTTAEVSGQYFARLGELGPGDSATVTLAELATTAGRFTQAASVSEDEFNIDQPAASATAMAQVQPSAGVVQFATPGIEVTDQAGVAVVSIVRLYGSTGTITVHYQAIAVNATPGLDFTPTSGTLTLGPGQSGGSISVPVLDDPYNNHDVYVNVVLDSPTGGASLGSATTSVIHIQDVDPDVTAPVVTSLTWSGWSGAISSLTLGFSAPLDPSYATSAADYRLLDAATGRALAIASISYNPSNFSVTVVPQAAIPSGQYDEIQVVGTGSGAIRDIAGNLLDGDGTGAPGSDYAAMFAQGKRLRYEDNGRNTVTLQLKGAGYLEQVLTPYGEGVTLKLVGMVPHRTTLTGKIKAQKGGSRQTMLGTLGGLGQFGDVKILLKTPPFRVTQLPFQRNGRYVL